MLPSSPRDSSKPLGSVCLINLYFSAVATYTAEEVKPTGELGEKWLEIEAKRNCRQ